MTRGGYVSPAPGDAQPHATFSHRPAGTKHRDHFWQGTGSFFTVSLSRAQSSQLLDTARAPRVAVHLRKERALGLAWALLMECVRWNSSSQLKADSLCLELLAVTSDNSLPSHRSPPPWLLAACQLIRDCPQKTPHVRDVAKTV